MTRRASRRRFLQSTGLAAVAAVAGCSTDGGDTAEQTPDTTTTTDTTTEAPTTTTTEAESAPANTVAMRTDNEGSYFTPKGLLVEPGDTVTFVNESGAHATTAYHPDNDAPLRIPEGASSWNSPVYSESDATFEVTFEEPGVYDYYCPPHEVLGMVGRIVVGEPKGGPGTTPLEEVPPAARESLPAVEDVVAKETIAGP